MIVNVNGCIEAISQPRYFQTNGKQGYSTSVVMKHDFRANQPQNQNPNTFLGYITFDVISTQERPNWKNMGLQIGEDVEVSLNVDVQIGKDGRWFNRITAFACERDKTKWHRATEIRQSSGRFPTQAPTYAQQAPQGMTIPQGVPQPPQMAPANQGGVPF